MEGYDEATYGDRLADVYDDWFGDLGDPRACVELLEQLAVQAMHDGDATRHAGADAPREPLVLELGIGTGRIALGLSGRDLDVRGIDASEEMLTALRSKPGADAIAVSVCDMAEAQLPRRPSDPAGDLGADLVFAAFNTLFALPDDDAQRRCLGRVAALLSPAGRFVVEAFVPDLAAGDNRVTVRRIEADRLVLLASVLDERARTIEGQYVDITEGGIRLRPFQVHYLSPPELDSLASEAGLQLEHRWADHNRARFDPATSPHHVSVYRRA